MTALTLDLHLALELTDEQFEQICRTNRDLRLERTAKGDLIIMPPTGGETGNRNIKLSTRVEIWNSQTNLGIAFDSSTGFKLPNGAIRSPDASWVQLERWQALTPLQRRKFIPLCPDFAIELMSPTDELGDTQAKMQEYLANGLQLGWLLDPDSKQVEIYRPAQPVEILQNPASLSGETVLPGFVLHLQEIL
ncbi:Uma2 family endonuclease [Pseudanabaena sp. PCC 6802]|uniref:Uma2 family endonuclease n=1 Tax=Pseudanabaena sp. PCC 6802 TaxID=118173 RepID=UPI000346353B|nr:Uma2 family endonuclease [Pseudanabaena sp. PCC 6802]